MTQNWYKFVDILGQECQTHSKKKIHTKNTFNFLIFRFYFVAIGVPNLSIKGQTVLSRAADSNRTRPRLVLRNESVHVSQITIYIDDNMYKSKIICTLTKLGT